jgi:carbon storage regulator CsrA
MYHFEAPTVAQVVHHLWRVAEKLYAEPGVFELILSRRLNERIALPGLNITIEVLSVKGNTVRLAVAAPDGIKIMREEVLHGSPVRGCRPRPP